MTLQKSLNLQRRLLVLLLLPLIWGCKKEETPRIAEIDGQPILVAEFEKTAGKEFFRQREALYRLQQQKLDEYIAALLLTNEAKQRKVSVATLLEEEVSAKARTITDDEVSAFYIRHKDYISGDPEKVKKEIAAHLHQQELQSQRTLYLDSLKSKAKVVTHLTAPPVFRATLSAVGAPMKGASNAPVTIVKFEDFECPFCKKAQPILKEILSRYDGKVRLVHKDLPLESIHPKARQAAEAARCAGDESKYWEYHDRLYAASPEVAIADLKSYAKEIGLNQESFDKCLSAGKYKAVIQKDLNDGAGLGLTGTPAFFINGREITGAQPLEVFTAIIDEELTLGK
jgi:protein-disulfide isomerase